MKLVTINDLLIRGNWNNNWSSSILDLGKQIVANSRNTLAMETRFTTTTLAEATAHTAVFMDIVKAYFAFHVMTRCGIPWLNITGTKEDWIQLGTTIGLLLTEIGLTEWNQELQNILEHFVNVFDGQINQAHWDQIYKYNGPQGSGEVASASGWIAKLFLYIGGSINPLINQPKLEKEKANSGTSRTNRTSQTINPKFTATPWLDEAYWRRNDPKEVSVSHQQTNKIQLSSFPSGVTSTPFKWIYYGETIQMNLIAGQVGVTVTAEGALRPEIGWVISEDKTTEANSQTPSKTIYDAMKSFIGL